MLGPSFVVDSCVADTRHRIPRSRGSFYWLSSRGPYHRVGLTGLGSYRAAKDPVVGYAVMGDERRIVDL